MRRALSTIGFTTAALALLASCSGTAIHREDTGVPLHAVPVPLTWTGSDADLPEELRLEEGDEIVRQNYSIDLNGRFTFTRSIQRTVGTIGLRAAEIDEFRAKRLGVSPGAGVVVDSTVADMPAAKAGLRRDDVLTRFGGKEILSLNQLATLVHDATPGESVRVDFVRGGERKQTEFEVAPQQIVVGARAVTRRLTVLDDSRHSGLVLAELTDEIRPLVLGDRDAETRGLLVIGMLVGGPAFFSDLRHRDLLLEFDGEPLDTIDDFRAALDKLTDGAKVDVVAKRGDRRFETTIRVSRNALEKTHVGFVGLFDYRHRPERESFSLLWNLLHKSQTIYRIEERDGQSFHETVSESKLLLGLFGITTTPHIKQLRFAWFFPLTFARD